MSASVGWKRSVRLKENREESSGMGALGSCAETGLIFIPMALTYEFANRSWFEHAAFVSNGGIGEHALSMHDENGV